jgi:NitT/TauT family transport system ATP-binding protein
MTGEVVCAVEHVTFSYPENAPEKPLFEDLSLNFCGGQTVALMGPSGCGKSTFAKMLGRILQPSKGIVRWRAEFMPAHEVIYVDQQLLNSVFPWQTVIENLRWPLKKRNWDKHAIEERAEHLLHSFRLEHLGDSLPRHISGGELQRLAIARCISWRPKALILDEALSALDRSIKEMVTNALRAEVTRHGMFLFLITHNLTEALSISDRCLVFGENGKRLVADTPVALPHPRSDSSPSYTAVQDNLLAVLRHGLI